MGETESSGEPKCHSGDIFKQEEVPIPRPMILHRLIVAATAGLCLAVAGISALGAKQNFDGDYTGKRSLTKGPPNRRCPAEDKVSVTIQGDRLTFTHSGLRKSTEPFYPGPDGSFGQTFTNEGGEIEHYHGRIIGNVMNVDVTNPPCEYHWHLKKE